ncbi:MAG TPA: hypothetical protein VGH91_07050 [Gammaproteobacteria bacterium]
MRVRRNENSTAATSRNCDTGGASNADTRTSNQDPIGADVRSLFLEFSDSLIHAALVRPAMCGVSVDETDDLVMGRWGDIKDYSVGRDWSARMPCQDDGSTRAGTQ